MTLDPFDCAFVYARGPAELEARKIPLPRNAAPAARLGAFIRRAVRRTVLSQGKLPRADVLFYVESANQLNSLVPIARELRAMGHSTCLLGAAHLEVDFGGCEALLPLAPGPADSLRGLLRGLVAARGVMRALRKIPQGQSVLDQLLEPYRLSPMFERALLQVAPKIVVVSNDHITSCRVLTWLARQKGIKTAYVQHAQVNSYFFPPLAFDYAFLDGKKALNVYSEIARKTGAALPDIFLSGEKKTPRIRRDAPERVCVGIGVNPFDDVESVRDLAERLFKGGVERIIVRLHPALRGPQEAAMRAGLAGLYAVDMHLAPDVRMTDFLKEISCLVAGESSVHIDALLSHVPSFYARLVQSRNDKHFADYYGFLSMGLVTTLPEDLGSLASADIHRRFPVNLDALKQISATVGTKWEGREALLAARTLAAASVANHHELARLYPGQDMCDGGRICFYT